MQPPPRKGNYSKFLKNLHTEQLGRLQLKNQHECELLEDIRQFTIKRCAIEKNYSESLLKLSSHFLNKKTPNIPEIKMDGVEERWNMWSVWQTVLEENEKLARARLAAIEVFQQQIADEAKILRSHKMSLSKKWLDNLQNIQKDVQLTVQEVDKTKKIYFDEEHSAHDVRDKARDIEEKLKKKKGSFFQSITSLQKNSARVTSRKEQLEEKSTGARNDYILSLASANAHQNRYFTVDLQTTMTTLESYVYERIADYLALIGRTELLTCSATQNSFGKIRDQAQQLTREYNIQCCYLFYPVLKQHIQYEFEPCDNDPVRKITAEIDSAAETLNHEGKRWAARVARENNSIRDFSRKLAHCMALRDAGHKADPNDINGPDLETKIDEFREQIRKSEIAKAKCEVRLMCLKEGGINIEEWIQEAETMSVQEMPRSGSTVSIKTDASGQNEAPSSDSFYDSDAEGQQDQQSVKNQKMEPQESTYSSDEEMERRASIPKSHPQEPPKMEQFAAWDDPSQQNWDNEPEEVAVATTSAAAATSEQLQTFKCTAIYSYTAQNPDELSIVENEQLEVVGEGDGDGWLRARNYRGEEGFVPHNYLDVERDVPQDQSQQQQLAQQFSFSSVDYTVDSEDQETVQSSGQSPDQVSVIAVAPVIVNDKAPTTPSTIAEPGQMYCVALYDYDATAEDELTFEEDQIIKLITMEPHGVDDGWWEGELNGKVGNFPSLVVELCDENGEPFSDPEDENEEYDDGEEETPMPMGAPPVIPGMTLADVIITSPPSQDTSMNFNFNKPNSNGRSLELDLKKRDIPAVSIVCGDAEENESNQGKKSSPTNGGGLGTVEISFTAATPMVEDADKQFLEPEGEESEDQRDNNNSTHAELEDHETPPDPEPEIFQPPQQQQQQQQQMSSDVISDTILEEPEKEEEEEAATAAAASTFDSKQQADPNAFETNFEAAFEANFDDAFGGDADTKVPKQLIGGRASIPEELEPHQLARLQNLKESNA